MTTVVIAEKPSVARDIAEVLGAQQPHDGYLEGNGYRISWAFGHLVGLAEPHQINGSWKRWRRDHLPIVPNKWPLITYPKSKKQFDTVRRLLNAKTTTTIICATDAGREGELIFRYIYEHTGCTKPVKRLWISSLTPDAIRKGLSKLKDGAEYDALAQAAKARSRADWLVGMNLSRAYSLENGEVFSVGRVQTPTLSMLVARDLAIRKFVPEEYLEVIATFHQNGMEPSQTYQGTFFRKELQKPSDGDSLNGNRPDGKSRSTTRLPKDGKEAQEIIDRARTGKCQIESVDKRQRRSSPPRLYDLTELQRHANRIYGFSASHTLTCAQNLYEKWKLISYPRTDSQYLSKDIAKTLKPIVSSISLPYRDLLAEGTGETELDSRFVDDTKVTDHHAIIPTAKSSDALDRQSDEHKIYDLICRRLLCTWHKDHLYSVTTITNRITSRSAQKTVTDRYRSIGTSVDRVGWKVLEIRSDTQSSNRKKDGQPIKEELESKQELPSGLTEGEAQTVVDAKAVTKKTRPPPHFTEATLLTGMETAGRTLDDKELSDAMRQHGLGTPATRASIIETLLNRKYVKRKRKTLQVTEKGFQLIQTVHDHVKSPAMTGEWEFRLRQIENGTDTFQSFMQGIEVYVREVVRKVFSESGEKPLSDLFAPEPSSNHSNQLTTIDLGRESATSHLRKSAMGDSPKGQSRTQKQTETSIEPQQPVARQAMESQPQELSAAPLDTSRSIDSSSLETGLQELLRNRFGFHKFRPHQERVCREVVKGEYILLVMPTGAGKSLCYQLPGLARQGTTLVLSPLIALMEDQVAKLRQTGLRADCIHSGRDRNNSRATSREYLAGRLDFLFVAPERLGVRGFPEMLLNHKPVLIAVDEAHCISQWGHDFRPDYRMIKERLLNLSSIPVIATTATATPLVQNDIVTQLSVGKFHRFIFGFRRPNIAIEVLEANPSERFDRVQKVLKKEGRIPAIIYAPTRKEAERAAEGLFTECESAAYHAGMSSQERDRVQSAFMQGDIQVVVATIAFGMGIDKPDIRTVIHMALPDSIEGYYQEIGRAGRDGKPSRAILLFSYSDLRKHQFFLERDYPTTEQLNQLFRLLKSTPQPKD